MESNSLGSLGQVCADYTTSKYFCMMAMKIIDTTSHKLIGRQGKFTLVLAMDCRNTTNGLFLVFVLCLQYQISTHKPVLSYYIIQSMTQV